MAPRSRGVLSHKWARAISLDAPDDRVDVCIRCGLSRRLLSSTVFEYRDPAQGSSWRKSRSTPPCLVAL